MDSTPSSSPRSADTQSSWHGLQSPVAVFRRHRESLRGEQAHDLGPDESTFDVTCGAIARGHPVGKSDPHHTPSCTGAEGRGGGIVAATPSCRQNYASTVRPTGPTRTFTQGLSTSTPSGEDTVISRTCIDPSQRRTLWDNPGGRHHPADGGILIRLPAEPIQD